MQRWSVARLVSSIHVTLLATILVQYGSSTNHSIKCYLHEKEKPPMPCMRKRNGTQPSLLEKEVVQPIITHCLAHQRLHHSTWSRPLQTCLCQGHAGFWSCVIIISCCCLQALWLAIAASMPIWWIARLVPNLSQPFPGSSATLVTCLTCEAWIASMLPCLGVMLNVYLDASQPRWWCSYDSTVS